MGFKVGSGDLERGSSSNVGGEGAGIDIATYAPSSSHPPTLAVAVLSMPLRKSAL